MRFIYKKNRNGKIGINGYAEELVIPSIIQGEKITDIGSGAFRYNENLTKVIISEGIETIGVSAFNRCRNLISVAIPKSVTRIGKRAFDGCNDNLTIYGYKGSCMEEYAADNCIMFKEIEEDDVEKMNDKEKRIVNQVVSKFSDEIPVDVDIELLGNQLKEIKDLLQIKGLTVKQAQLLLKLCSEYILDCTLI